MARDLTESLRAEADSIKSSNQTGSSQCIPQVNIAHGANPLAREGLTDLTQNARIEARRGNQNRAIYHSTKRALDFCAAWILLILTLPAFVIICLLILIDSGRPVFFNQVRVGKEGKLFTMYKFRTMYTWAPKYALKPERDDERITRVGRFLRRTSLDELPQLWNIVKGNMSLVGPRPEQPFLVEQYESWQRGRLSVLPGLTGWWQVSGRSNLPLHENIEYDVYYVENRSLWLDLKILCHTIWAVIKGIGAF